MDDFSELSSAKNGAFTAFHGIPANKFPAFGGKGLVGATFRVGYWNIWIIELVLKKNVK